MAKTIRTRFINLIALSVLLGTSIVIGCTVYFGGKSIISNSEKSMTEVTAEVATELNTKMSRVQNVVDILDKYATNNIESLSKLSTDTSYRNSFTNDLQNLSLSIAQDMPEVVTVYARYNPTCVDPTSGFFYTRVDMQSPLTYCAPTDFSMYDENDAEHVGWYYIPVHNGVATWMAPYKNENIDIYMISYVCPFYDSNSNVCGVIGMDIDFRVISNIISNIKIFNSGYGLILDKDLHLYYHPTLTENDPGEEFRTAFLDYLENNVNDELFKYEVDGETRYIASTTLINDLTFCVVATKTEVYSSFWNLLKYIGIFSVISFGIFVIVAIFITKRIVKPLDELNIAADQLANGNFGVEIKYNRNDEIGKLGDSFRLCAQRLNSQFNEVKSAAYQDPLTGVGSKLAYDNEIDKLNNLILKGDTSNKFGVLVADVNNLKKVNDTLGHSEGDIFIREGCSIIGNVFKESKIYRIGGDEFACIVMDKKLEQIEIMLDRLEREVRTRIDNAFDITRTATIAYGFAAFDFHKDHSYDMVFKRADALMYENKKNIKKIISKSSF